MEKYTWEELIKLLCVVIRKFLKFMMKDQYKCTRNGHIVHIVNSIQFKDISIFSNIFSNLYLKNLARLNDDGPNQRKPTSSL